MTSNVAVSKSPASAATVENANVTTSLMTACEDEDDDRVQELLSAGEVSISRNKL